MSQEKLKILEMIQNKTITAQEGADLLNAVERDKKEPIKTKQAFKMFRIKILSNDGDKVNVSIPLEFAKMALSGSKSGGKQFMKLDKLKDMDIDLDFDQILDLIESGTDGKIVDIESADGDIVKIFVE